VERMRTHQMTKLIIVINGGEESVGDLQQRL